MKNTLSDLNNYLFEQIERLMDSDLDLDNEIKRAKTLSSISSNIINNAELVLEAEKFKQEYFIGKELKEMPAMLENN